MHGERTALTPWAREAKPARQSKMPGNGRLLSPGAYGLFVKWWVRFGVNVFMNTTIEFTSDRFDLSTQKPRQSEVAMCARTKNMWDGSTSVAPPLKTLRAKSHNDVTVWHSKHSTTNLLVTRSNTAGVLNHWVGVGLFRPLACLIPGGETHLAFLAMLTMTELWCSRSAVMMLACLATP